MVKRSLVILCSALGLDSMCQVSSACYWEYRFCKGKKVRLITAR